MLPKTPQLVLGVAQQLKLQKSSLRWQNDNICLRHNR